MNKLFSVIIPTYNRCNILRKTLAALFKQSLGPALFEVVVVDDGSTDDTPHFVQSLIESAPLTLRYKRQKNCGAGAARNRGLMLAHGEYVLFIDDDIIVDRMILQEHLRYHRLHSKLNEAVLGRVALAPELPDTYFNRAHALFKWEKIANCDLVGWPYFMTGNISLKRRFLLDKGLCFDEHFLAPAYDDTEMGYRAAQHGLCIFYNKQAVGYHFHSMNSDQVIEKARKNGYALAMLHQKHPEIKAEVGESLVFSWRNPLRRIIKDLIKPFLRNRAIVPLFRFLAKALEERDQGLSIFFYRQVSAYYERVGYREGLAKAKVDPYD
jgi:glycosyltransferase involved in cell wall biosynthesis